MFSLKHVEHNYSYILLLDMNGTSKKDLVLWSDETKNGELFGSKPTR